MMINNKGKGRIISFLLDSGYLKNTVSQKIQFEWHI